VEPETIVDAPTHANGPPVVRHVFRTCPQICPDHPQSVPANSTQERRPSRIADSTQGRNFPIAMGDQFTAIETTRRTGNRRSPRHGLIFNHFRESLDYPARRGPVAAGPRPAFARRLIQTSGASSGNLVATNIVLGRDQEQQGTTTTRRSRTFTALEQHPELRKFQRPEAELTPSSERPTSNL
jgi:hypothetical protein